MKRALFFLVCALWPALLYAADDAVPAIQPTAANALPPTVDPLAPTMPVLLTPKEKAGVRIAQQWADYPDIPAPGEDGAVIYLYGASMPSVVCKPLAVCDIELEPGEKDTGEPNLGDSVRWLLSRAESGPDASKVVHVIVKPRYAGLTTDMHIFTDRRSYTIKLISTADLYMPKVRFAYPEELARQWADARQKSGRASGADRAAVPASAASGALTDLSKLDFAYDLSGDDPLWKPARVYNNGLKTFIQFPPAVKADEMPVLVMLSEDDEIRDVPYRPVGNTFVVDKVLRRAELIAGVGSSAVKVVLTHGSEGAR